MSTNILNVISVLCLSPECFRSTVFPGMGAIALGLKQQEMGAIALRLKQAIKRVLNR
ncbi:hypothetical protein QUA37_17090 [Microcoleus sp. Pol12A6]|uniref:hypothetical protein n=1 Tax=Microcoleus sp. Pol12B3 TaxID=3055394 RepID=UPI002FD7921B